MTAPPQYKKILIKDEEIIPLFHQTHVGLVGPWIEYVTQSNKDILEQVCLCPEIKNGSNWVEFLPITKKAHATMTRMFNI